MTEGDGGTAEASGGAAVEWARARLALSGPPVLARERSWATTWRLPLTGGGSAWLKACSPVQRFEPGLSVRLAGRWPDRVGEVLAHEPNRAWLLLRDAGTALGDRPERLGAFERLLPLYAELQRGEARHADEHLACGVPDLRVERLPALFGERFAGDLPLDEGAARRLRAGRHRFARACGELAAAGRPATVQHDDLHVANVFVRGREVRLLDWGDASIAHPFFSLVVAFRILAIDGAIVPGDGWRERLCAAYLEPWGAGHEDELALALRVGAVAFALAWARQRAALTAIGRTGFDAPFADVLRSALAAL